MFWFNGNGIPERYWIPREDGRGLRADAVPGAARSLRNDIHVISGIDNAGAQLVGPGNGHHKSISGVV